MQIEMRVLELLSSKLCHDLVSPVSAINNGVELIEDIGGGVVDEAMKLIGDSAAHASRRLRLFRTAYGRAGSEEGLPVKDVKQTAEQYMAGGKVTLNWPDDQPPAATAQAGYLKVILNMIILAEEVLPYGGVVSLRAATDGSTAGCRFEIVGRSAQLSPQMQAALIGSALVEELTPRTIQAYITGKFAAHFNLKLKFDQSIPDRLDLSLYAAEIQAAA
ncbi:MAG TPA: histidine phosphotransferase family protein [Alphaproteobacteria bacterium]|nr:histidine phosphotransferase family protein [Alphaproteobacteria bacterium]